MAWTIEFDEQARAQLKKLDRPTAKRLGAFLRDRVGALENPRQIGKALQGSKLGNFWAYRVGDCRIICDLQDSRLIVLAIAIGHRSAIYR